MKRTTRLVLMASLSVFPGGAWAGAGSSGGGNLVFCEKSPKNELHGYYSLDYVLTSEGGDKDIVPARTLEESLNRIERLLMEKVPQVAESLRVYRSFLPNRTDWSKPRIWTPSHHGLVYLDDQNMLDQLPENCRQEKIVQTVIRLKKKAFIQYKFHPSSIDALAKASAIQVSFLHVHEWLRDLTDDEESIRNADRLLHSDQLERMGSEQVAATLRNLGFGEYITREEQLARERTDVLLKEVSDLDLKESSVALLQREMARLQDLRDGLSEYNDGRVAIWISRINNELNKRRVKEERKSFYDQIEPSCGPRGLSDCSAEFLRKHLNYLGSLVVEDADDRQTITRVIAQIRRILSGRS